MFKGNYIYFAESYSIKQRDTVEYLSCQHDSKLSGEALASNFLRQINAKLNFLYRKSIYLIPAFKRLMQCANSATFRLQMFFLVSSFKEKFKNQTSKSSKQIYSISPRFTFEILYRSISLYKNKVTSSFRQSRTLYCEYRF